MDKQEPSLLKAELTSALLTCATMATKEGRDIIVNELTFKSQITRNAADRFDVFNIVNACLKAQGGLTTLLELVESFEGKSNAIDTVKEAAKALQRYAIESPAKPTPNPAKPAQATVTTAVATGDEPVATVLSNDASASSAVGAAPITSTREEPMGFYEGPAFALVIGISLYKHGTDPNRELEARQFTNLRCAAKDATDFIEFLNKPGPIKYTVRPLRDNEATVTKIKDQLEQLRKDCKACANSGKKDPLVVIYFSGHGMRDEDGRSYLIPHEAERNRLFATALWNKDFNNCLDELETRRLVVFLDACHSGGIGMPDEKSGPFQYDPQKDLLSRRGHYIIASSAPGQVSQEGEENSIFTGHLLRLLNSETTEIAEEEIDLFDLFQALKAKVGSYAEIKERTGIILAINEKVREQTRAKKIEFVEMLGKTLKELKQSAQFKKSATLKSLLESYAEGTATDKKYANMFEIFDEFFQCWSPDDSSQVGECCQRLTAAYTKAEGKRLSNLMLER